MLSSDSSIRDLIREKSGNEVDKLQEIHSKSPITQKPPITQEFPIIQVDVYHFPGHTRGHPGHISIQINCSDTSYFFDFGGKGTLNKNKDQYGMPDRYSLELPKNAPTYDEATLYATKIQKEKFQLLNYNCTDAAIDFLNELGYEQFKSSDFISTPSNLAQQIKDSKLSVPIEYKRNTTESPLSACRATIDYKAAEEETLSSDRSPPPIDEPLSAQPHSLSS
jgi:hypothetical protein